MIETHTYVDLPDVRRGTLKGPMAFSVTAFMQALCSHRACSSAGDHGSIMVYRDDKRRWRCFFLVWRSIREQQSYGTKAGVHAWLKRSWPKMRDRVHDQQRGKP